MARALAVVCFLPRTKHLLLFEHYAASDQAGHGHVNPIASPFCCPILQAAETEALDIVKGAEVERAALLKASETAPTAPPAESKYEPPAGVTKPDVSKPKMSTSTPLSPPPSPEAASPP